jgi:hypothetical protein
MSHCCMGVVRSVLAGGTRLLQCDNVLELNVEHYSLSCNECARSSCRDMEIFRVNAPYLPWRACVRGVKEGLWCTHWPQHSSLGAGQLIDDTCHLGKDAGWSPGPAPARLALATCLLRTWPPHRVGAGAPQDPCQPRTQTRLGTGG